MDTYFILCADNENSKERWCSFCGYPHKQLIPTDGGEILLYRTVRLLKERAPNSRICIVTNSSEKEFDIDGTLRVIDGQITDPHTCEGACVNLISMWDGACIFLYGDVYYSDGCVDKICYHAVQNNYTDIHFFGRKAASTITGKNYQEQFAVYVNEKNKDKFVNAIHAIYEMFQKNEICRITGWQLYDYLHGNPPINQMGVESVIDKGDWTEIDDWTEDFDYPDDYITWLDRKVKDGFRNFMKECKCHEAS